MAEILIMPAFLYNKDNRNGKSFKDRDEFMDALDGEWVESPDDIGKETSNPYRDAPANPEPDGDPEPKKRGRKSKEDE